MSFWKSLVEGAVDKGDGKPPNNGGNGSPAVFGRSEQTI